MPSEDTQFQPGNVANPNGRPKGTTQSKRLMDAIAKVEKEDDKNLYEHFVKEAFSSRTVLIALFKKLVPDMKFIEGDTDVGIRNFADLVKAIKENGGQP